MAKKFTEDETIQLLRTINESIIEKKGENIINLNLENIENAITKYFVICSGTSNTHVNTIAQFIEHNVREKLKDKPWKKEGFENSEWVLLDYVNIVVHIFQPEARSFYRLEQLWADADTTMVEGN
ncbi:MAG: ribosome silencing factor [Bacteroidales bacterium]|jgi:ribosome-associated protein|nr:ribosome silencing factor [Bacteroidales bacterium]